MADVLKISLSAHGRGKNAIGKAATSININAGMAASAKNPSEA